MTTFLISFIIFAAFTVIVAIIFGILPSLSDSYYALKKYKLGWVFQAVLFTSSFLMGVTMFPLLDGYWFQFLSFFVSLPLMFTALTPDFQNPGPGKSLESGVHGKSAGLSATASLLLVICIAIWINPSTWIVIFGSITFGGIGYLLNGGQNGLYWAEYTCFSWLYTSIYSLI